MFFSFFSSFVQVVPTCPCCPSIDIVSTSSVLLLCNMMERLATRLR